MFHFSRFDRTLIFALLAGSVVGSTGCGDNSDPQGADGPAGANVNQFPHSDGDATAGKILFRMETFGDENFWTDVVKLPQGIMAAGFTPKQALAAGYNINIDALPTATQAAIAAEVQTDLSPANAPMLNDPATTIALINANSVIGVVARDSNNDGTIDITAGDKVGVACAFCHAITDGSTFAMPNGGTIGHEVDGPTPHTLNVGATFAIAANTRALYPIAQLALTANGGNTIGRAPAGLTEHSTEAEIDAYFSNPDYYPIGMFDDQPDGTGAPMHITPMFRGDLSAPYGSEGTIAKLDNFTNLVFTVLLDQRDITTPGGRAFLHTLGGAAGDEIVDDYVSILTETGVPLDPALEVSTTGMPGMEATPVGVRVDDTKLLDMNAYMDGLQAPAGVAGDAASIARGETLFRNNCTSCHNVDQSKFVPSMLIPMATIYPGDSPVVLAQRTPPLNPIENTVASIFDDKMVVVNASIRGDIRGIALPLLIDLARKPVFLHDNSVPSLDELLDSSRGSSAPHPFYLEGQDRTDMIALLKSFTAN
jgi:cytochrome c2